MLKKIKYLLFLLLVYYILPIFAVQYSAHSASSLYRDLRN